jgi:hypothetical protein
MTGAKIGARMMAVAAGAALLAHVEAASGWAGPPRADAAPEFAQPKPPPLEVPLDEAARALVDAEYLKPEERRALRLKHGVFEAADLEDAASRARAAALLGRWGDASLSDPALPPEDRAEAMVWRGEYSAALELLKDSTSAKGIALRVTIHQMQGRADEARRDAQALVAMVGTREVKSADQLLWIVRGLTRAARCRAGERCGSAGRGLQDSAGHSRSGPGATGQAGPVCTRWRRRSCCGRRTVGRRRVRRWKRRFR